MAATLKAGGASSTQSTKLMLPHEMLTSSSTQSVMGGHSTLLLNSNTSFFSHHHHHLTSQTSNHHTTSFQGSFSSFAATPTNVATATTNAPQMHNHNSIIGTQSLAPSSSSSSSSLTTTNAAIMSPSEIKTEEGESKDNDASETTTHTTNGVEESGEGAPDDEPEIDIVISNVVCSFSVRCHLNLRTIALNGFNVEFRRENGMVTMKLRRPYTTASIWSSGRITCTGATSESMAKIAARKYARCLQKLGFRVRFHNFRIVNVLGTCSMPWAIKITPFSEKHRKDASYEPELHPGVTYKLKEPKATLKIFSTGSITVTGGLTLYILLIAK